MIANLMPGTPFSKKPLENKGKIDFYKLVGVVQKKPGSSYQGEVVNKMFPDWSKRFQVRGFGASSLRV